ncbi:MAG: YheU family protein [Sandaracinaceae bacterium]|nr:YheU family protein [Sandaracinaceae bacterium]
MSDGVVVPLERLSEAALLGLIDDFVLREGTDYGHDDIPLERKRADVRRQLERGEVRIVFDPRTETCTLVPAEAPRAEPSGRSSKPGD